MLGTAGQPGLLAVVVECEPELGGDHDLVADRLQGFADELFVDEGAVDLGGVEEGDTALDGGAQQGDVGVPIGAGAVALAHAHRAEADGRDLEVGAERALLQGDSLDLALRDGRAGGVGGGGPGGEQP